MKYRLGLLALAVAACTPHSTVRTARYPDGRPKFEYETEYGVPNGMGRVWYPNGTMRSEGRYERGIKEGVFAFYDPTGTLVARVTYLHGMEVARSGDVTDVDGALATTALPPPRPADLVAEALTRGPLPSFATLDRTTELARTGGQVGVSGGNGLAFGDVSRYEAFANVVLGTFGAYAQVAQSFVSTTGLSAAGRQTVDVGGTYHLALSRLDHVSVRAGVLAGLGNTDPEGAFAAAAGAAQRTADVAESTASSVGLRTSGSFVRRARYLVLQSDIGVDWMFGERGTAVDPILRFDAGAGVGLRSVVIGVEVANAVRARDTSQRLSTVAVSATVWIQRVWVGAALSSSQHGEAALIGSVGYGL